MKLLYLAHDLADPAVARRVSMLQIGGAAVSVAGFRRAGSAGTPVAGIDPIELGRTADARLARRAASVVRTAFDLRTHLARAGRPDVILARNLEMLALGWRMARALGPDVALAYELLDVHRLLLREGLPGRILRGAEAIFARRAGLLLTSSPAFAREYGGGRAGFRLPTLLVENKVMPGGSDAATARLAAPAGPPWRIGWFGMLRCRRSLLALADLARRMEGRVEIVLRGRPALTAIPDFHAVVANARHLVFDGPYRYPDDLPAIYGSVHFAWAIDFFEAGRNSSWLLPNRLYEGCHHGVVPIAMGDVETGRFLRERGIGMVLDEAPELALPERFARLSAADQVAAVDAIRARPASDFVVSREDCVDLVRRLGSLRGSGTAVLPDMSARPEAAW